MKLLLATHNKNKAREFSEIFSVILGKKVDVLTLSDIGFHDEIVEDGTTFEENAFIKANVAKSLGYIGIGDDSGLCVDALNGAPGIYSARFSGEDADYKRNNEKLLAIMKDIPYEKRSAYFICTIVVAFPDGRDDFSVCGICKGHIAEKESGDGGFGYDPLFVCDEIGKTFASLSPSEKNEISHRGRAIKALAEKLDEMKDEFIL